MEPGNPTDPRKARRRREVAIQTAALGFEFSGSVIGGLIFGYYLDSWLGTAPWLLILFTFGGMGTAVARLVALTRRFQRIREDEARQTEPR